MRNPPTCSMLMALAAAALGCTAPALAGDLLVSSFTTNSIHRFDSQTGQPLGVFASGGGLHWPHGMAFGPDGHLYVSSWFNSQVLRYDGQTGAFMDVFIEAGTGGLSRPEHLQFHNGMLYVQTGGQDLGVLRYDASGKFINQIVYPPDGDPLFAYCEGMAISDEGDVFVSARNLNQVMRFDGQSGEFEGIIAEFVNGPEGLAFGLDGNLYAAEYYGDSVSRFTSDGDWAGFLLFNQTAVDGPMDVGFDEAGDVYVVSYLGDSVNVYDSSNGQLLRFMHNVPDQPTTLAFMPDPTPIMQADINGDGSVDVDDLLAVIVEWGPCLALPATCPADVNTSGVVDVDDLLLVIVNWG